MDLEESLLAFIDINGEVHTTVILSIKAEYINDRYHLFNDMINDYEDSKQYFYYTYSIIFLYKGIEIFISFDDDEEGSHIQHVLSKLDLDICLDTPETEIINILKAKHRLALGKFSEYNICTKGISILFDNPNGWYSSEIEIGLF